MIQHKQAPITLDGEIVYTVDEKLQGLIQFLLDNGIETYHSCEDDIDGMTFIEYPLDDWIAINEIAFRNTDRALYSFIQEQCDAFTQCFDNGYPDDDEDRWIEGKDLVWIASVTFPSRYLPRFEQLIRKHLSLQPKPERLQ